MSEAVVEDEDARVERRRLERRHGVMSRLPEPTLVALAGAPFWTPAALTACGLDVEAIASARGLVRREGEADEETLAIEPNALPEVLVRLRAASIDRLAILAQHGAVVAELAGMPPVLHEWARVAVRLRGGDYEAAAGLLDDVRARCDRGDLGGATQLIEAAGAIARVVGGEVAIAERVARHRVEREFRDVRDRKTLSFFVGRDEAMAAFRDLLADAGPWALHYVGVGGAGKTTFIRHLAVEQAVQLGLAVARVDFDYLSPAYPGRDPGQLVQAIVHELAAQIDRTEQDRWLQSAKDKLELLKVLAAETRPDGSPLGPIDWPEFQEMLNPVISFLGSLQRRPVIVLDTCEELLKLPPVEGKIPSVEATFKLIEMLHAQVPHLRVIFAGRRLLARAGAGWAAAPGTPLTGLSEPRPELALCELRGMTAGEADGVLDRLLPETRRADAKLRAAILAHCPEDSRVNGLGQPKADEPARFSPFRIVRYARWVAVEPAMRVEDLEKGGDPYIEQRIVQRMGALEELLPTVVQLRRFDAAMLAAVRGVQPGVAARLVEELAGHEWIEASSDAVRGTIVEAKATIRDQLEAYLVANRPGAWQDAQRAIAMALAPQLAGARPMALPVELVDAALRAMPETQAVRAWFALERAIGDDWAGALALTRVLLGDGEAPKPVRRRVLLDCALRATHASALIQQHPDIDVTENWRAIVEITGRMEQVDDVRVLGARAKLGFVAAAAWGGHESGAVLSEQLDAAIAQIGETARAVAATWVVAAFEGLIECLERGLGTVPKLDRLAKGQWWSGWFAAVAPGLDAWVAVLRARAWALLRDDERTREALGEALVMEKWDLPPTCMDWLPPASMHDRARLEAVRFGLHATGGAVDSTTDDVGDDTDRLRAALALEPTRHVTRRSLGLREPKVYRLFGSAAFAAELRDLDAGTTFAHALEPLEQLRVLLARARHTRDPALLASGQKSETASRLYIEVAQAEAIVLERSAAITAINAEQAIEQWTFQRALKQRELHAAVDAMRPHVDALAALAADASLAGLAAVACVEEVATLSRFTAEPIAWIEPERKAKPAHPDEREQALRLALRRWGMQPSAPRPESADAALVIAEAELLALRFPDRAARLYSLVTSGPVAELAARRAEDCKRANEDVKIGRGAPREASTVKRGLLQLERALPSLEIGLSIAVGLFLGTVIIVGTWLLADHVVAPALEHLLGLHHAHWLRYLVVGIAFIALGALTTFKPARAWAWLRAHYPWRYQPRIQIASARGVAVATLALRDRTIATSGEFPSIGALPHWDGDEARAAIAREAAVVAPELLTLRFAVPANLAQHAWEPGFVGKIGNVVAMRTMPGHASPASTVARLVGRPRRVPGGIVLDSEPKLPAAGDVILQLAPQDADQASLATRTELALLRELAASMIERGARSVLVIPAIANADVPAVTAAIDKALGSHANRSPKHLAAAANAARTILARSTRGDHVVVADEITLYLATDEES